MAIRLKNNDSSGSWLVFTDLTVGLFTLFVLAFVALVTLKHQTDTEFTRTEKELTELQEAYRKAVTERNALLARNLKSTLEKGLIVIDDGKINIQASVLFDRGQARIKAGGKDILGEISRGLTASLDTSQLIMVSGYTDDTPIASNTYTNWELSTERATTVVRHLISTGFPEERIFAAGFGEFHPKVSNDSEENRAINRRVEIAVAPVRTTLFGLPQGLMMPEKKK